MQGCRLAMFSLIRTVPVWVGTSTVQSNGVETQTGPQTTGLGLDGPGLHQSQQHDLLDSFTKCHSPLATTTWHHPPATSHLPL